MSNWEWKKLGDVCTIHGRIGWQGLTKKEHRKTGDYLLITGVNFTNNNTVDYDSCVYVEKERYIQDPNIQVRKNDLLITKDGTLGKLALITEDPPKPATLNGGLFVIRNADNTIYPNFLMNVMKSDSFRKRIEKSITGSTVPHLTQNMLVNFPIPIPPLAEQKRIVKTLDEKFSKIDKLKNAAETNLKNAREIFNAELNSKLNVENENLPQGWEWKRIKEIGKNQTGQTPPTNDKRNWGNYIPFLKPANISNDGIVDLENAEYLSQKGLNCSRLIPSESTLMVCIGASIGKVGYIKENVTCNQQINACTPSKENYGKYVYYAMKSDFFQKLVKYNAAQATLPILNKSKWENLQIPLPPLSEQKRIVAHLDNLSEKVKRLEENYQRTIADCEELKKSILKQVFEVET